MLKLEHVKKSYDGVTILQDMNMEIEDGEIVSILGPSGCGKTTLLNLILGLTDADAGKKSILTGRTSPMCQWKREASILFSRIMPYSRISASIKILSMASEISQIFPRGRKWMN